MIAPGETSGSRELFSQRGRHKRREPIESSGPCLSDLEVLPSGLRPLPASAHNWMRVFQRKGPEWKKGIQPFGGTSWLIICQNGSFPSFFPSAGHVESLQISAGSAVSGHQRCFDVEGWLGKWVTVSLGGPSALSLPEGLGTRIWRKLVQWSLCPAGAAVSGLGELGQSEARKPSFPARYLVFLQQQEPSSKPWWVSVPGSQGCRSVRMWGLCRFGPFVSFSTLVFRSTSLETRPSTWYSPACFETIQLEHLHPLCAGLPRINPLPFQILTGCASCFLAIL